MSARLILLIAIAACGSGRRQMYPAGSDQDDGYGDLAQKSARLLIGDKAEAPPLASRRGHRNRYAGEPYGGNPYGGGMYGGDPYGGVDLAPPLAAASRASPPRPPPYNPTAGLTGAIEGTVTWHAARRAPLITACGAVENQSARAGASHAAGGVLVYIEHVEVGRAIPSYGRPATVGGIVTKHGCILAPALQILTPLPATLAINGDATAVTLRITQPSGAEPFELQQAGRVLLQAQPGITRIEADDGSLGVAWVVASDTPYYAITDDAGRFRIDELAAGTYELTFWRPPLASALNGKLIYGQPVVVHRSVKVDAARPARLDVSLDR